MVKRKASPKKGSSAGYAARIEPPVSDSTDESSEALQVSTNPTMTSSPIKKKPTARKSTAPIPRPKLTVKKKKSRVLKEIKRLQTSTNLLIPRAPFLRLVTRYLFI